MPPRKVPEFQTQHMPNRDLRVYDCLQKTLQELRMLSSVTLREAIVQKIPFFL